jgi:hypothetical protein
MTSKREKNKKLMKTKRGYKRKQKKENKIKREK